MDESIGTGGFFPVYKINSEWSRWYIVAKSLFFNIKINVIRTLMMIRPCFLENKSNVSIPNIPSQYEISGVCFGYEQSFYSSISFLFKEFSFVMWIHIQRFICCKREVC